MAVNYKLEREQWRLETDMNVPPVDTDFQFRTLQSRHIPYDMRYRQVDIETNRGQKPDTQPRSSSLIRSSKVTFDKPTHPPSTQDKTIRQHHLQIPIPTPRHVRYIHYDPLSIPLPQTFIYEPEKEVLSVNLKCPV